MKTIECLYNEIISCPSKWIYWDYNDSIADEVKEIIPDFSSMYNEGCGERLIMKLLRVGNKSGCSLVENVKHLSTERKRHIISLFFIGHLLYDRINVISDCVNAQINALGFPQKEDEPIGSQKLFSFLWILLCLYHDLGYAYEEGKLRIEDASSLEDIYSKLINDFNPPIYNVNNVANHDKYRLCKWGVKDHGIWGGRMFFKNMLQIKTLLLQTARIDKTNVFCTKDIDHIYAFAAWITICHNLRYDNGKEYVDCFKCQHLEDFIKSKARCINLKSNPLLFLFCLADTLEPTKILKSKKENQQSLEICKLLELNISANILSFSLDKLMDYAAGDKYKEVILSMSDWLIDVNTDTLSIAFSK